MRFTMPLIFAAAAALLIGCAPAVSIHPLYTPQDLVADSSLEGQWAASDGEFWQVQRSGDGYAVTVFHAGETSAEAFNIHLLRLKDTEFADATSKSNPSLGITGHLLARISLQGDDLRVALLDDDWMKKAVKSGQAPQSITGEENGQIILTAPTGDLQRFVLQHAADADAWDADVGVFHRMR
ncbi:MAG TPA: hypothetical protein VMR62_07270 [Bryobacteraceae bacterium]|jgi:hypothetical protein|nr:hypothetical protein [Bryobacteraceae bacterium]